MKHIIKNLEALAENDLRRDALEIAEAGYAAVDTGRAIERTLRVEKDGLHIQDKIYKLADRRVFFVGVGKCAFAAAKAVEKILGNTLTGGIALDVTPAEQYELRKVETYIGTHPLPSEVNERAAKRVLEFLLNCSTDDLVILLASGGGSTLLCSYEKPMTTADESRLFRDLTAKGATIQDMNTVRKHTSKARGGGLARAAYPAEVVSLIVSDVPGDDIQFVSSGPTVKDDSTIKDAEAVLSRYGVDSSRVVLMETPKEEKYFDKVTNILFLTNKNALYAMRDEAIKRGYATEIVDEHFTGEASDIGRAIVQKLHASAPKTALLYAGESTVTLSKNSGEGGRNQEMALAAMEVVRPGEIIIPFDSDGRDDDDNAGAIGDTISCAHALMHNLSIAEYLDAHNSYNFFSATGDALRTGYTGSNVADCVVALKK